MPSPDHTKTMKSKLGEWELIEDEEKPFKSVFSKGKGMTSHHQNQINNQGFYSNSCAKHLEKSLIKHLKFG